MSGKPLPEQRRHGYDSNGLNEPLYREAGRRLAEMLREAEKEKMSGVVRVEVSMRDGAFYRIRDVRERTHG